MKKLKYIFDIIWYDSKEFFYNEEFWSFYELIDWWFFRLSDKDIIFTQKFIDKVRDYMNKIDYDSRSRENLLLSNLNDPVSYLYNLIKENE